MRILVLLTVIFPLFCFSHPVSKNVADLYVDSPKPLEPHWKGKIEERAASGQPLKIVYYEELGDAPEVPVKVVTYYLNGQIKQECDVTSVLLEEDLKVMPHGVEVSLDEKGGLEQIAHYIKGQLHGELKLFFPNGRLKAHTYFKEGKRHGSSILYFLEGNKSEEFEYAEDKLVGEYVRYYPKDQGGKRLMTISYVEGLPHGNAMEWYPNGSLKKVVHYERGVVDSDGKNPAIVIRSEDYTLLEVQDFRGGEPIGTHIKYHPNGREAYRCSYKEGKQDGKELFLSKDGKVLGEGVYQEGVSIGKHWRNHENGALAFLAHFDDKGILLDPIQEWNDEGILISQYFLKEGRFDGSFKQWYDSGKLKCEFCYLEGELEGPQREYYLSSKLKSQAFYKDKFLEGEYLEWYENGQPALKMSFKKGEKEGETLAWFPNGQKKLEESIFGGNLSGKRSEWYGNGVIKTEGFFRDGLKEGVHREFNEKGDPLVEIHYENDLPHGLVCCWHENKQIKHSMRFIKGKKEGPEEQFYSNGSLKSRATYKEGAVDGEVKTFFEEGGPHLEQSFVAGIPVGEHLEFYPREKGQQEPQLSGILRYDENGRLQGDAETFYPTGQLQSFKRYRDNELHGTSASWDQEGNLLVEICYEEGKMNGRFFQKLEDGKEVIYHYRKNQRHGPHQIYYPVQEGMAKQKAFEVTFEEGFPEGDAIEYDEKGNKLSSTFYVQGLKEGSCQIFNKGALLMQISFKKDKKHGTLNEYYPKGEILSDVSYQEDQKHGEEKSYFRDGTPAHYAQYVHDKLEGRSYRWNEKGIIIFEGEYKEGLRVGKFNKYYDDGKPRVLQTFLNDQLHGIKKSYDEKGICSESRWEHGKRVG